MRRFFGEMNPTLRGFLLIALVAAVVVALSLQPTLAALFLLARIAFFLAIAFFVYLVWRERRSDIGGWSSRSQWTFYGAAALLVFALALFFVPGYELAGLDAVAWILALAGGVYAMVRVWRDEHRYGRP